MKLLIVESPTKAKTIARFIPDKDIKVEASVGHIRDIPKSNKDAIDINNGFTPRYIIPEEKKKVVATLKKQVEKADSVYLATDPDREGEAIAWHIQEVCDIKNPQRVVFHEITKEAVSEALAHPRDIDMNLKKAQEARRVLDRLFGYDLSGLIWKKVRYGLSAGRVQSPALRIIVEREKEIRAFKPETYWIIDALFSTEKKETLPATYEKTLTDEEEKDEVLKRIPSASWHIADIQESQATRKPRAPFTTSTLQQSASSLLGYSPSITMRLAQKLYEAGHITYMRTDSISLSSQAIGQIASVIEKTYGKNYLEIRHYKTTSKNAQEAHEAIRPTNSAISSAGATPQEKKLYDLIRTRALTSQMKDAQIEKKKILITDETNADTFVSTGSHIIFDGWLKADIRAKQEDVLLPSLEKGQPLTLVSHESEEKQTEPPRRYSEAGLIKELEKRGIGRPSTYATIIQTLQKRGYVIKEKRSLIPTDTGEVVSDFLSQYFSNYISDSFTAEMEDELDDIAQGKRTYEKTLSDFYTPFTQEIAAKQDIEKLTTLGKAPDNIVCPLCGSGMVQKLGRGGIFLSCDRFPECHGARTKDGKEIQPPKDTGKICPRCKKGTLVEKDGKYGKFTACSKYPKCTYIEKNEEQEKEYLEKYSTGITCPICKKGHMVERKGRYGTFYSCSQYPSCTYTTKAKPLNKICGYKREDGTTCQALMMEGTKTIPQRCSDKTCPNHNPHKL